LAKQLVKHAAGVNGVLWYKQTTPLHTACSSDMATNLEFIDLLLQSGVNPNARNTLGLTLLMCSIKWAPSAAKVLIEWPTTNINIVDQSGRAVLALVRMVIEELSDAMDSLENPRRAEDHFFFSSGVKLKRCWWKRGASDTRTTIS
jgi:hypothetical protein